MTPPEYAFDPSAQRQTFGVGGESNDLVEVYLERGEDGRLGLTVITDDAQVTSITWLRPDFLDAFLAQARAREQSAA